MSAYLVVALGMLAWVIVAFVAAGLWIAAKRGDARIAERIRDVSR